MKKVIHTHSNIFDSTHQSTVYKGLHRVGI